MGYTINLNDTDPTIPVGKLGVKWQKGIVPADPAQPVPVSAYVEASGSSVLHGTVDPTTQGNDGDFYINTATNFLFGPKAAGVWPAGISLIGPTGAAGATGTYGGAITFDYLFDTGTSNADPGSGNLRLNNSTENVATALYINTTDHNTSAVSALLDSLTASTNTIKGEFRLVKRTDATKFLVFNITGFTTHSGYREYAITIVSSSAASPFGASDEILLMFSRAGDAGTNGTVASRANVVYTTGVIAIGGTEQGSFAIAKSFAIVAVSVDRSCRVRLYSTAAQQVADLGRGTFSPPPINTSHGVILDIVLDGSSAAPLTNFICSPEIYGANGDPSPTSTIYYAITNKSALSHTVQVTLLAKIEEA